MRRQDRQALILRRHAASPANADPRSSTVDGSGTAPPAADVVYVPCSNAAVLSTRLTSVKNPSPLGLGVIARSNERALPPDPRNVPVTCPTTPDVALAKDKPARG